VNFGRCFGVFVRDLETGLFQGGLFGRLFVEEAAVPYSFIECFWLDESTRGAGFGRIIMDIALNFSKEEGSHAVQLFTSSDQARGFYEKLGFTPVHVSKPLYQSPDGSWVNNNVYRKYI